MFYLICQKWKDNHHSWLSNSAKPHIMQSCHSWTIQQASQNSQRRSSFLWIIEIYCMLYPCVQLLFEPERMLESYERKPQKSHIQATSKPHKKKQSQRVKKKFLHSFQIYTSFIYSSPLSRSAFFTSKMQSPGIFGILVFLKKPLIQTLHSFVVVFSCYQC